MVGIPGPVEAFESRLGERLQREVSCVAPNSPATAARGAQRIAERFVENDAY